MMDTVVSQELKNFKEDMLKSNNELKMMDKFESDLHKEFKSFRKVVSVHQKNLKDEFNTFKKDLLDDYGKASKTAQKSKDNYVKIQRKLAKTEPAYRMMKNISNQYQNIQNKQTNNPGFVSLDTGANTSKDKSKEK